MNTNNFSPEMLDPALPGSEIVIQGLADIQRGAITPFSVILFVAAPRFRLLGIEITNFCRPRGDIPATMPF